MIYADNAATTKVSRTAFEHHAVLYARQGIPLTNVIEGGAQERGKRAGTENVPSIVSMSAALEEACAHMEENAVKVSALRDRLIARLSQIPHCALNGDLVNRLPGNVNFCFEGIEGESLLLLPDDRGICASSGSMATELIKGKPLSEALKLTNQAVIEVLDGLPTHKLHCSVLAEEAIQAAVKDYYDKHGIPYDPAQFPDCEHCEGCSH